MQSDSLEEYGLDSVKKREMAVGISRTATNVWKLPSVRNMFISVDQGWFETYMTEAFEYVNDCYAGQVIDDGHIALLVLLTETYEVCQKV